MSTSMTFCDHCGAANPADAVLCVACRQPVQTGPDAAVKGDLMVDQILHQRYRLLQRVGKGGFGEVYRGADTQLGERAVAIKVMNQGGLDSQELGEAMEAFKNEAFLLANLKHPHLPSIHDYFTEAGHAYLVMDFIEGMTLERRWAQQPARRLPAREVLEMACQLCDVLEYLHTRQPAIIFRDLKPANVIRAPDGHLFLIDFGIARLFKPGQAKDTTAFGSAGYAAPEQYGKAQTTAQADIYSLGATLHALLTGKDPSEDPFQFEPPQDLVPAIHAEFSALIMQMLSMTPRKRPTSVAEIRERLQNNKALWGENVVPLVVSGKPPELDLTRMPFPQGAVAWSPDGNLLASVSGNQLARIWNPRSGETLHLFGEPKESLSTLAWAPAGSLEQGRIATGGKDSTVSIWNADLSRPDLVYHGHLHPVLSVAWSPDGNYIVSASLDQTAHVWNAQTGDQIFLFKRHRGALSIAAWSSDGAYIASGGRDGVVHIWSAFRGMVRRSYQGHTGAVSALAWSPDGNSIASGGESGDLHVWNTIDGKLVAVHQHGGPVSAASWSPDGKQIVSCGEQGIQIWETRGGVTSLSSTTTSAVAYAPDGGRIASAGSNGTEIWNVPAAQYSPRLRGM